VAERPDQRARSAGGTDFDDWKDSYSQAIERAVPFISEDHDFFVRTKADELLRLVARRLGPPAAIRALDVGCGLGLMHRHLAPRLGRLEGADVAEASLERARADNPTVGYAAYDGERLPFADGSTDLTFAVGVVHHVPPPRWAPFVAELGRVTRPGGLVAIVDPNPLNPLCRPVASRCEFDRDANFVRARRLRRIAAGAGLKDLEVRYILFVPFDVPARRAIERGLAWLPLGAQYLLSGRVVGPVGAPR
jgi:SAM-dependent methyltransferase